MSKDLKYGTPRQPAPSENPPPSASGGSQSAATRTGRDVCDVCGASDWVEGHFSAGKLLCPLCWAGREPPAAMPPTARERQLILDWLRPAPKSEARP